MAFDYMAEYRRWMESASLSQAEREELKALSGNEKELKSRFYAPLEFGTAGLRGIMGPGLNRMNVYVVRQATSGLAELIRREGAGAMERGCVICHDCRNNSRAFAEAAAEIMAGSGIRTRIFEDMRPTPELSFAIRKYGAMAGINITASHNPKEYNGYKVYWEDGAQLPPEHAEKVANVMSETDILNIPVVKSYKSAVEEGIISVIGREMDEAFMEAVFAQCMAKELVARAGDMKIVYTPFHGAGMKLVPEVLRRMGVKELFCVPKQMKPDGNFSTVASPNPENPEGFALAEELANEVGADILIGTDPDSDRIGVMIRGRDGAFHQISGNKMGVLLIDYIITSRKKSGTLPENAAVLKTIVTTDMARAAAEKNGAACFETFTGFKFMAERMKQFEQDGSYTPIFAYEESYGCLIGDFVRDKDAVTASAMMVEMAAYYHLQGRSLLDAIDELYEKYGFYDEKTINIVMPGVDGIERRHSLMRKLHEKIPDTFGGRRVTAYRDYLAGTERGCGGEVRRLELHGSDVIVCVLDDGSRVAVRPSGTEPKIKIYILVCGSSKDDCMRKLEECEASAKLLAEM